MQPGFNVFYCGWSFEPMNQHYWHGWQFYRLNSRLFTYQSWLEDVELFASFQLPSASEFPLHRGPLRCVSASNSGTFFGEAGWIGVLYHMHKKTCCRKHPLSCTKRRPFVWRFISWAVWVVHRSKLDQLADGPTTQPQAWRRQWKKGKKSTTWFGFQAKQHLKADHSNDCKFLDLSGAQCPSSKLLNGFPSQTFPAANPLISRSL